MTLRGSGDSAPSYKEKIMFEKLSHIELSGESYPLKCDLAVLEQIQDEYGDLIEFEQMLYRFIPKLDENGEEVKNEEGRIIGNYAYPNLKAAGDTLFWMIQEGLEIEAEGNKEKPKKVDRKNLMKKADMSPIDLGIILHQEYIKCFERKNG